MRINKPVHCEGCNYELMASVVASVSNKHSSHDSLFITYNNIHEPLQGIQLSFYHVALLQCLYFFSDYFLYLIKKTRSSIYNLYFGFLVKTKGASKNMDSGLKEKPLSDLFLFPTKKKIYVNVYEYI